jgi:GT2 family glycosyltransferase
MTGMSGSPRVTIVVSPRERFGMAQKSLESIYASSDIPFELVYIDARSPDWLSQWLKAESAKRGFRVIQRDRFVTPNEARNLGAAASTTDYIVFIDNDVICSPGWLGALVKTADETSAAGVAPLICEGEPQTARVHQATGTFSGDKEAFFTATHGDRELVDVMVHHKATLSRVRDQLRRQDTDVCEFHCLLVRRSFFEEIGRLDEELYATREHIDFSMCVLKAGGRLVFEPASEVTYVFPSRANPMTADDMPYFLLRWSPQWQLKSLEHLQQKWGLKRSGQFAQFLDPNSLRWRHNEGYVKPIIRKMPVVRKSYRLSQAARRLLNLYMDWKVGRLQAQYENDRTKERQAA